MLWTRLVGSLRLRIGVCLARLRPPTTYFERWGLGVAGLMLGLDGTNLEIVGCVAEDDFIKPQEAF